MKIISSMILLILALDCGAQRFEQNQLANERVKIAYQKKETKVLGLLKSKEISLDKFDLFFRGLKNEKKLEVWAKNKKEQDFKLVESYPFCAFSGVLGPKRKEGDLQIPEGFYMVDKYNPQSNFYLSLELNYPNKSDRILSDKIAPGGQVYIHGNCVTIGCIPLGDENIMELYVLAVKARNAGQTNIPVYIFPFKMNDKQMNEQMKKHQTNTTLCSFWKELKEVYDFFEKNKSLPSIKVNEKGQYVISK